MNLLFYITLFGAGAAILPPSPIELGRYHTLPLGVSILNATPSVRARSPMRNPQLQNATPRVRLRDRSQD